MERQAPPPEPPEHRFVVFQGDSRIATGSLDSAGKAAVAAMARRPSDPVLIFDGATGAVVDLDLRDAQTLVDPESGASPETRTRGRPRLGVVAREVTLLPRHWEWLSLQPGGASATLRRLVDTARKANAGAEHVRARREAAYRFMATMAGDRPGFEEAARALFADKPDELVRRIADWPADVQDQTLSLLAGT